MIGNNLKILTKPIVNANTTEVNPRVTPKICGTVFFIPKLKPEYEATMLFGPGVQAATIQNNAIDKNSGCIFKLQANHSLLFEMDGVM